MMRIRRIAAIRQLSDADCGPACLAMILTHFGRHTTLHGLRERIVAGRDGVSLTALLHLAEEEGLRHRVHQLAASKLHGISLPALLHWRDKHFVVLEWITPTQSGIVDPAFGTRTVPNAELTRDFSGTAVEFETDPAFRPDPGTPERHLWRYLQWLFTPAGVRRYLGAATVASLILQLFGLVVPVTTAVLVDSSATWRAYGWPTILVALLSITLTRVALAWVRGNFIARLQRLADRHASTGFFDHLLRLPHRFFLQRTTGDLLIRLNSNAAIRDLFTTQLVMTSLDAPMVLGYLGLLIVLALPLAALAVVSAVLQTGIIGFAIRRQRDLASQTLAARADEHGCTVEALAGITYVKAVAAEAALLTRWQSAFARHQDVAFETAMLNTRVEALLGGIRLATPIGALLLGMQQVDAGAMSLGAMLAAITLVTSFVQPVITVLQSAQQLHLAGAYMERIMDVLDSAPEVGSLEEGATAMPTSLPPRRLPNGRRIECRDVEFRFGSSAPLVLHGINCAIPAGGTLGLIGATGSGKSTLAKILLGLWVPTAGEVMHDGELLNGQTTRSYRRRSGAVLQDLDVFSGTILENITLGHSHASLEDARQAASLACLDPEIQAMPLGYHTQIGDRGMSLSGGQRQRLALARALLHRPDFLVLDEATSQLDVRTERQVNRAIRELGCTRLIVSHRLSAVEEADWVLVMNQGRIVAEGRPRDVLRRSAPGEDARTSNGVRRAG